MKRTCKRVLGHFLTVLIFWMVTAGIGTASPPASPGLYAELTPDRAKVGDVVTLTLRYFLPPGGSTGERANIGGLEEMTVLDRVAISDPAKGKSQQAGEQGEIRLKLLVDRVEDFETGPLSLTYADNEGEKQVLKADPLKVSVSSNLEGKPEEAQLAPIYGIIPTKLPWSAYLPWAIGVLLAGLMAVLLIRRYKKRRGRTTAFRSETPAHVMAQRQLHELNQERLFERGHVKAFYFRFSKILRHYLEALRGFPAAEYTTEEIAHSIRSPEDRDLLQLLKEADRVKFADLRPTQVRQQDGLEKAFSYIRNTGSAFDPLPAIQDAPRRLGSAKSHHEEAGL
ncbi:MAG: hypothetical protein ACQEQ7_09020 [Thermodesulfobacteriota bacterium]